MKHTGQDKEQCNLQKEKSSFTHNHREGVGILMSKSVARALMDWAPINERIIQARYYSQHMKMTIVHIYASTEDADEQVKFYRKLQDILGGRNANDMLITGDMNAKVGDENSEYERVMGRHRPGERNGNGERLCEMCDMNKLVITAHSQIRIYTRQHGYPWMG